MERSRRSRRASPSSRSWPTLAAIVVVGQAVGRHVASAAKPTWRRCEALGIARSEQTFGLVLLVLPAALGGAALAAVTAWLASPLMPIGLARRAEPDPGFSADWSVLCLGAIAIIVVVLLAATVAATWQTRPRGAARAVPAPPR